MELALLLENVGGGDCFSILPLKHIPLSLLSQQEGRCGWGVTVLLIKAYQGAFSLQTSCLGSVFFSLVKYGV